MATSKGFGATKRLEEAGCVWRFTDFLEDFDLLVLPFLVAVFGGVWAASSILVCCPLVARPERRGSSVTHGSQHKLGDQADDGKRTGATDEVFNAYRTWCWFDNAQRSFTAYRGGFKQMILSRL